MDVAEMGGARWWTRRHVVAAVRILGLVAIFLVARLAVEPSRGGIEDALTLFGIWFVVGALWLVVTGTFGYGSPQRSDWVAVIPFLVALVVREFLTLHSVEEIELAFAYGPRVKHSVVHALAQLFYAPLVSDAPSFTMHLNGVLGAYASLPLYLFVRQRVASRAAGFLCALFLAVHPIVARFAPTDGPYSLMLAGWFSGLVLLSAHPLEPRALLGSALLLGIAATTRIEGVVILVATALLLDPRRLLAGARADPLVAIFAVLIVASFGAVQMFAQLRDFWGMPMNPDLISSATTEAVWLGSYSDGSFACLVWLGAVIGITKRFRLGLCAFVATLIVVAPIAPSSGWIPAHHRLVPTCALQAIVAGMGAYALTAWLPRKPGRSWLAVAPGALLALWLLFQTRGALSEPQPFTEQYDIIRAHLAPGGTPLTDCTLMAFNPAHDALDLHDIAQVVPQIRALDCSRVDCVKEIESGGCFFYFRTTTAYFNPDGLPLGCTAAAAASRSDSTACLSPTATRLEGSMEMQPVETRVVTLAGKLPSAPLAYPADVAVGLFRVRPR